MARSQVERDQPHRQSSPLALPPFNKAPGLASVGIHIQSEQCDVQECKCAPVAFEPLSCHKAAVLTVIVKMPTGDDEFSPPDQCGIAIGSALVTLGIIIIIIIINDVYIAQVRKSKHD